MDNWGVLHDCRIAGYVILNVLSNISSDYSIVVESALHLDKIHALIELSFKLSPITENYQYSNFSLWEFYINT